MADFTLTLFSSILNTTPALLADLTPRQGAGFANAGPLQAGGWRRTVRGMGGYWEGSFSLSGTEEEILQAWNEWLGCHLVERAGGVKTWEGMVYEMDLHYRGNHRRRTLDLLANAVKTTYTTLDYSGADLLTNGDFEAGDLSGWSSDGAAAVGDPTHGGSAWAADVTSAGMESDGSDDNYIRQNVNVSPGNVYQLTAWLYGSDEPARIGIRDPNASEWLFAPRGYGGWLSWSKAAISPIVGPSGGEILIVLYGPPDAGDVGHFDDVEFLERQEAVYETDWITEDPPPGPSISTYGRKEHREVADNLPWASSVALQRTLLAYHKDPWARPVGLDTSNEVTLDVRVCGYVWTMNWLYVQSGDGSTGDLGDWLEDITGTDFGLSPEHCTTGDTPVTTAGDCQFVKVGRIETNTLQVVQRATMDERPWDMIAEVCKLGIADRLAITAVGVGAGGTFTVAGDYRSVFVTGFVFTVDGSTNNDGDWTVASSTYTGGNTVITVTGTVDATADGDIIYRYLPARAYVDNGRLFVYEKMDVEPRYYMRGSQLYDHVGAQDAVSPWAIRPGVVRDMNYPVRRQDYNSIFADARDSYVDEVEVSADGAISLRSTEFSEADVWRARAGVLEFEYGGDGDDDGGIPFKRW